MLIWQVRAPMESLHKRRFGIARTNGKNEKTRRRNADRRMVFRRASGHGRAWIRQAPIYRRDPFVLFSATAQPCRSLKPLHRGGSGLGD
jgi:hypothetical protein